MRSKDTIEFLGLWELLNNPDFKPVEFDGFKKEAGYNAILIKQGISQPERLLLLNKMAIEQIKVIENHHGRLLS
jgi:hypothetical protein